MRRAEACENISRNAARLACGSERIAMAPALEPTESPAPARLLLAEDDFELRELLACVLRADGHEVVEARDGNELLAMLSHDASEPGGAFSLVVSDVRMPGLTAFDILSRLQRELSEIPVILITAFGDQTTHARALRLGVPTPRLRRR
jgi:CheY-like chemotaxis protein